MIYFIRHGESNANEKGVFARDDAVLTSRGINQVNQAAKQILSKKINFDHIFSSPLLRAKQTAQIIADTISFEKEKIEYDSKIAEYRVGEMAGKSEKGTTSSELISAKGAEDPYKFKDRVANFLNQYKDSKEKILMVSHTGVGRMIEVINENRDPAIFYDLPKWPNATLIRLNLK